MHVLSPTADSKKAWEETHSSSSAHSVIPSCQHLAANGFENA